MNRRFSCAMVALAFLACAPLHAQEKLSDWPQFRGPGGQGISTDKNVPLTWGPNKNLAWKVDLPGPGASSPIVFGSHIYLTCYVGKPNAFDLTLLALKREDGSVVWSKKVTPSLPDRPTMRENHGYASATPAADASGVYCFFGKSGAVAFDHDGKQLWRTPVGERLHEWGSAASPVLFGDFVIINAGVESGAVLGLDKKTGKETWRAPGNKEDGWNTPILVPLKNGKTELVLAMGGKVHGLDPTTGKTAWTCRTDIGWYMVPGLVAEDGLVCAIGGRSGVAALAVRAGGQGDVTKTHRLWTSTKGSNVSSPILHEGHLYYVNDATGVAFCTKAATGEVVYQERLGSNANFYSSAVLADGKIFYTSRTGRTHVVAASPKFQELAQNDVGERTIFNSSPAIAGGRIYLRTDRYLYCIGAK
jgi:outer membrane protein assembly factor BamB